MGWYLWNDDTYWVVILKKQLTFTVIFVKIWYFGGHFLLRRNLKMLNADRVSAVDFLKLMVLWRQIHKKKTTHTHTQKQQQQQPIVNQTKVDRAGCRTKYN